MPQDSSAPTLITGFSKVPEFAHGRVRDIRIRWALEEIGRPYRTQLFDAFQPRPDGYRDWQPFGQVPAYDDGNVRLFESGAILLHLGEQDERLLPRGGEARSQAISWLIAALNSVEPALMNVVWIELFNAGKDWSRAALPDAAAFARLRLKSLSDAVGEREWLAGPFSIADVMMVTVLRDVDHTDMIAGFPNLAAYKARGEARPAFGRALSDQLAGFRQSEAA